jgi:hypothetical protein
MLQSLLNVFIGCSHKRTTFPLTESHTARKRTYVSCLDCGREFDYNWKQMKIADSEASVSVSSSVPATHH